MVFRLKLAGNQTWHLTATPDRHDLVAEMARVMELGSADVAEDATRLTLTGPDGVAALGNGDGGHRPVYQDTRVRIWRVPDRDDFLCEIPRAVAGDDFYQTLRSAVQIVHHRSVMQGGLPVHGALMEWKGRGVLLAAVGGTGKSTCCRRLPGPWKAWCDDEVLVVRTGPGQYAAHPFPTWSHFLDGGGDRTWVTETTIPLAAIFHLEQGSEDSVAPLPASDAAMYLYHAIFPVYHRRISKHLEDGARQSLKSQLFHNACDISLVTPSHILRASLHGRFWAKMEEALA